MKWRVVARPQAEDDIIEAADWYDSQRTGLGDEFIEEILAVFVALEKNPLLYCRQHSTKNIRWRYPKRFPYRVIYEVNEDERRVVIAGVIHAARHDRIWRSRILSCTISNPLNEMKIACEIGSFSSPAALARANFNPCDPPRKYRRSIAESDPS